MAPPNLTREQAEQRAALLEVQSYAIELDLSAGAGGPEVETFGSTTTVRFRSATPGAESWIDLVAARVRSAVLNGVELDVSDYDESTGIRLPELAADNELVVHADCQYTNTGEGLHRFIDPVDGGVYLYSQFETADAKRMFTCFDQPDLKATYQITVTAPQDWKVISNAAGEVTDTGEGTRRHVFDTTKPMSTYLVALVAGPYAEWRDVFPGDDGQDEIPLGIYCRASLAEHLDAERLFIETKQGFGFFHKAFGVPYPFGKYDQCFVPEFNAGAMENAGCVTFLEDYVFRSRVTGYLYERRSETVLHEMAHMWFGDLVTMRWWDDLWLNESFATWASVLAQVGATQYTNAWTTFASVEKSWAYRQDQLPSTHPVAADIPDLQAVEVNFDGITYAKGASVLKQLVAYVGLENFLAGLKVYFDRHAWGNATLDDLLVALEEASGRDLSWWSAQWLQTTGLNMLRPKLAIDDEGRFTSFSVLQSPARPGAGEHRTHRLAIGIYDDDPATGELVRTHRVELDVTGERTEVPDLVGVHRGKLVLVNDDDLTYCTMRLDPQSLATLIDRIADIQESLPRALCWSTAWEMTREAELKARDFVSLVLGSSPTTGIGAESEIGVVQRVLLQTQTALASYADPAWQPEGWRRFAGRLLELARAAEPGSDHQLAFVNSLAGSVLGEEQISAMRGWLDGTAPLEGLTVDTDLRWGLLQALVAHGAAGEAEIDAELERDQTATGRRRAERARSLIPTPEAKEKAWQRAVHDDQLPNAISDAIISGFQHPGQRELLASYVRRYFDEIDEVWHRRSSERAQPTVIGLFPSWAVDEDTVAVADRWLEGEHAPALRRLVSEGRAGIVRALAAREFDRS
ncbi:aminopeptidase N [Saccharopolyspora erythraea NRRL 2338]|uniref:Aminopeptidase N n=2 Tax=Saccharopolyspora erythraea TaxID=1836 RepID=A4F9D7_SACEN|nr:aminopeptidase N [Saccharopolyspora erythraea]EQD82184.1 aminopeptidase N [Saccharopolyspora erythraea D]PFG94450.1 aminopeptidase N [Saccharopolyspora erythraea NRRL 2338]QRK91208.1 aminopeptidase N [Saccharopolyspora erythraea]CAM00662.1 membrane alanyl aminopeptidase [Saccharopolyspora erythraea NRRL 2338]